MRWKAVSGIMLTLLLIGMLTSIFNIQPVQSSGTIYIRADGSVEGTDKIQRVGDVYTFTDNIYDEIVVERDGIVVDGASYTVQGTGSGTGIDLSHRNNVTLKNVEVTNFYYGINFYYGSSNNTLTGNTISNNTYGIYLLSSSNNVLTGNTASNNNLDGILIGGSNNTLTGNTISNNEYGIRIMSGNHTLTGNTISNNHYNFGVSGGNFNNYVDTSNTVDSKPIYYLIGVADAVYDAGTNAGIIYLINCNNVTIRDLTSTKNSYGVLFFNTINSKIENVTATNNERGIRLYSSSNNTLTGNTISNNEYGINLHWSSNNTLSGNNATNNDKHGINLDNSGNNTLTGNTATNNSAGIRLTEPFSHDNVLTGNFASNNTWGIYLTYSSSNNVLTNNTASNNEYGIFLVSSNNTLFHNNLINNAFQASVITGYVNTWDNGYPSGGNFWSDYTGPDANSDGIGDTPYVIDENNQDNYPLMSIWGDVDAGPPVADAGPDLTVDAGTTVTFNGSKSIDDVAIKSYVWAFTDITPQTLTGVQPTYTFNNIGDFEVTLNVSDYAGNWNTDMVTITVQLPEHELVASMTAPTSLQLGSSSSLNATVTNQGQSDETNVELALLINGTIVDSTAIPLLQLGNSYTLSYIWTPTVGGTYNVTAYAHPVSDETSIQNNQITKFVIVVVPPPSEVQVGVEAGDWIKCDYTVTGWPSGTPRPEWLKVEILSVEGTTAIVRVTMHMSDGTEQSDTLSVDVVAGGGTFDTLFGFVIPANCTTGDSIIMGGDGFTFNVTIDGETTGTYAGASRTVVYASFSQYGSELTYYWDKETGVMVEASTTSGGITGTAKATETNMWEATTSPLWMQWWFYAIVAAGIVALVGVVYFLKKRKPTPTAPPPPTEGTRENRNQLNARRVS